AAVLCLLCLCAPLAAADEPAAEAEASPPKTDVVNINTAETGQLTYLPRVGPALAGRIVDFREQNGAFEAPEDLMLIRGIGEKTFKLMEPHIVVKGETTLSEKVRPSRD
ncbi:MAG: helix-hairpin-helix domain-containing protein, partial [Acidobacteriota bacterium]